MHIQITEDFWWVTDTLIREMREYHRYQMLKENKSPVAVNASPSGISLFTIEQFGLFF